MKILITMDLMKIWDFPKVTDCIHSQETICWTLLTSIRDLALLESL